MPSSLLLILLNAHLIGGVDPSLSDQFLIPSFFHNVPPVIKFVFLNESSVPNNIPFAIKQHLVWSYCTEPTSTIVRNTGFLLKNCSISHNCIGTWERPPTTHEFALLFKTQEFKKVNNFPMSHVLSNKDLMWTHVNSLAKIHGPDEFKLIPITYVIPGEEDEYKRDVARNTTKSWIVKRALGTRSIGLNIIKNGEELGVAAGRSYVVQKYISSTYYVNGCKTHFRLHAMATSYTPLRLYVQDDIQFKFVDTPRLGVPFDHGHLCLHLPHYKMKHPAICKEEVVTRTCLPLPALFWNKTALDNYMTETGKDHRLFWSQIDDIIIKTVLASVHVISSAATKQLPSRYNAFQFWSIDFALDETFTPHLLEFNRKTILTADPSKWGSAHKDLAKLKNEAASGALTLAGFHLPPNLSQAARELLYTSERPYQVLTFRKELYTFKLSQTAISKQQQFSGSTIENRSQYIESILRDLTPDDIRQLVVAEDELNRVKYYRRIFPTQSTWAYLKYLKRENIYYYLLQDAWEAAHGQNRTNGINRLIRLTKQNIHLQP